MPDKELPPTPPAIPWPEKPPPGWPPQVPWPPKLPVGGTSMKKCVESCVAQLGVEYLWLCALLCAAGEPGNGAGHAGGGTSPPPPPPPGKGVHEAIHAIDDDIILELKQVARHRANAAAELDRAASNYREGNKDVGDEQTRSARKETAKADEIEIEVRGKERAKRAAEKFK